MKSADDDSDDSFSSGSDDEFLTMRDSGGNVDREALVRKKLLENFYGKGTPTSNSNKGAAKHDDGLSSSSDDDDDDGDGNHVTPEASRDLDSNHFDAAQHTAKHVLTANVHSLLEVEEALACQVRTLDSSMQTLVYENYSRFIEATDAVKSIGVNVQAHGSGLTELQERMETVSTQSRAVETSVGALRDQVVEKIRVKRLLQRLDALLKLPSTLQSHMALQKYRWATKSYLSAHAILNKHSEGFDSLKKIETECHGIMQRLLETVKHKLVHWSGASLLFLEEEDDDDDNTEIPDPPTSILDIFECAGAPILILQSESSNFETGLTVEQCQEYSLKACLRWLERVLDTHQIELQEHMMEVAAGGGTTTTTTAHTTTPGRTTSDSENGPEEPSSSLTWLVPTDVLDSILEAATLYSMTFLSQEENKAKVPDEALSVFVSSAFSTFLAHVRGALLEQALQASPSSVTAPTTAVVEDDLDHSEIKTGIEAMNEQAYEQIASAMTLLLDGVRQLASGLALQDVAVDNDLASSLIDQTVSLTETMVRRRVDQQFFSLRQSVINDCLAPMARSALLLQSETKEQEEKENEEEQSLLQVVQLASVALSDSLQLVDDTVRSILAATDASTNSILTDDVTLMENAKPPPTPQPTKTSTTKTTSSTSSSDSGMLLEAVEQSTKRFAFWLAATLEILSGCEPSHPKLMLQVSSEPAKKKLDTDTASSYGTVTSMSESNDGGNDLDVPMVAPATEDSEDPVMEKALLDLMEEIAQHHQSAPASKDTIKHESNMILAIAEMCRVAERSVMENILQSISVHGGVRGKQRNKAKSFEVGSAFNNNMGDTNNPISARFRLGASRILSLYAVNRGSMAANSLCDELMKNKFSTEEGEVSESPRRGVLQVLEAIKVTCHDCADLFGGPKMAGPVPENLEDEFISLTMSHAKSGLAIDVERMFAEKIVVYPHPNDIVDFSRNGVVVLIFKVVLKAFVEHCRRVVFSLSGYRQLMVDMEFIKFLLPHYVKDEFLADGSNSKSVLLALLAEASSTARKRCRAVSELGEAQEEMNVARGAIREFMAENSQGLVKRIVIEDGDK
eukprot:scaffold2576_cov116-Cylindrotheca_fusiformis.AAC.3